MRRIIKPVGLALFLVLALFVGVNAQQFYTTMDDVVMRSLIVTTSAAISEDATIGDDLVIADAATVGGILTVSGALNAVGNSSTNGTWSATGAMSTGGNMSTALFYKATNQGNLTITEGGAFTPTGTFQGITAAGSVSSGQIVVPASGTIFTLINFGSNTITLTETASLVTSGNLALGQYDNATFISDGTRAILLATTNN